MDCVLGRWPVAEGLGRRGRPVTLAEMSNSPAGGASWGADDTILINHARIGISQVPGGCGIPKVVIPVESGEIGLPGPQLLPRGEWVLFLVLPSRQIAIQSLITGERQVLIENGDGTVRYVPTGHLVYASTEPCSGGHSTPTPRPSRPARCRWSRGSPDPERYCAIRCCLQRHSRVFPREGRADTRVGRP